MFSHPQFDLVSLLISCKISILIILIADTDLTYYGVGQQAQAKMLQYFIRGTISYVNEKLDRFV